MARRLYLDAADLFDIGDGRLDPALVADLGAAMNETGTLLMLSHDHVHDAARGGTSSLDSLARAAEVFGVVLVVMAGPGAVEPLTPELGDIAVERCTNFRELVFAKAAAEPIAMLSAAHDRFHSGDRAAQVELAATPLPALRSNKADALFMQSFITLCRGWQGDDPETILSFWELDLGVRVSREEREGILRRLQGARAMVTSMLAVATEHEIDITEALRNAGTWGTNPDTCPGHHLALRISGARRRDVRRKPQRSDWSDIDHAMHFPYADVATCDRNTREIVARVLPTMKCPRSPLVLHNRQLDQVVEAVRRLGAWR